MKEAHDKPQKFKGSDLESIDLLFAVIDLDFTGIWFMQEDKAVASQALCQDGDLVNCSELNGTWNFFFYENSGQKPGNLTCSLLVEHLRGAVQAAPLWGDHEGLPGILLWFRLARRQLGCNELGFEALWF